MVAPTIFFLGGTGYIGSQVLTAILGLDHAYSITVLTRKEDKLKLVDQLRPGQVKGIQGSLSDLQLLEDQAAGHDITINTADADDLEATKAILKGQAKRKAQTGHRPILIHTSGTGVLADDAAGRYPGEKIYTDITGRVPAPSKDSSPIKSDVLPISSLPDSAMHREVDLAIIAADKASDIRSFIILPSTIYGLGVGELIVKGIGNDQSIQMPALIKASVDRGRAGTVGEGKNIWPNVHVSDIAALFIVVFRLAIRGDAGNHGENGYYFGESGEHTLLAVGETIGKAMNKQGLSKEVTPTTFSKAEIDKYFGGSAYLGSNSRAHADHSRQIGWKPRYDTSNFLASLEREVERTVERKPEGGWDWGGKL